MEGRKFIQVILPLRLEWEPFYALPEGVDVQVGDRVSVTFAHRDYVGAVSAVGVEPEKGTDRILDISRKEDGLPSVLPEEIRFWRAMADYYLCSVGEVYKAAYPARKVDLEEVAARNRERLLARLEKLKGQLEKARKDETRERYRKAIADTEAALRGEKVRTEPGDVSLSPAQQAAYEAIRKAFQARKTVLLNGVTGSGKTEIYLKLAREVLRQGRNVLYLVPEIALSRQLEERIAEIFPDVQIYHSAETEARRRSVADAVRGAATWSSAPDPPSFSPITTSGSSLSMKSTTPPTNRILPPQDTMPVRVPSCSGSFRELPCCWAVQHRRWKPSTMLKTGDLQKLT